MTLRGRFYFSSTDAHKKEPSGESPEIRRPHVGGRRMRQGKRKYLQHGFLYPLVWELRRPDWSWRHISLSAVLEVVRRLRQAHRRENQLSVHWIRWGNQTALRRYRRLRCLRQSDER